MRLLELNLKRNVPQGEAAGSFVVDAAEVMPEPMRFLWELSCDGYLFRKHVMPQKARQAFTTGRGAGAFDGISKKLSKGGVPLVLL